MIERNGPHSVIVGLPQQAFPFFKGCFFLGPEGMGGAKYDLPASVRTPLTDCQDEGISGDEIPCISR